MKTSFKIFEIFKISVKLHISFILFILFLVSLNFFTSPIYGIKSFILLTALFSVVVLHELVHSIVALKFKFKVKSITLFPIGGAADVEIKENPKAEFFIALAGPFFNFLFAWVCLILLFIITPNFSMYLNYFQIFSLEFPLNLEGILGMIVWINFVLGAFNLFFPAFPMDGGRIIRALLAMKFNYVKATKLASSISKILLFLFGLYAIMLLSTKYAFTGIIILIIIMFLFIAGETETRFVEMREKFKNIRARDLAMHILEIDGNLKVSDAIMYLSGYSNIKIFPVSMNGKIYGSINIEEISNKDMGKYVYEISNTNVTSINANSYISDEFEKFLVNDLIIVKDQNFGNDFIIGYITKEMLERLNKDIKDADDK